MPDTMTAIESLAMPTPGTGGLETAIRSSRTTDRFVCCEAILQAAPRCTSETAFVQTVGSILVEYGYISKLAVYRTQRLGPLESPSFQLQAVSTRLAPAEEQACQQCLALRQSSPSGRSSFPGNGFHLWIMDIDTSHDPQDRLVAIGPPDPHNGSQVASVIAFVAHCMEHWRLRLDYQHRATEVRHLAALTEIQMDVQQSEHLDETCQKIADHLHWLWQCDDVIVGLCDYRHERCQVVAASGMEIPSFSSEVRRLAEAAMQESLVRGNLATWPPQMGDDRHALCAHRQFAEHIEADSLVSVVLRDKRGDAYGVLLITGDPSVVLGAELLHWMTAAQRPLAVTLRSVALSQRYRIAAGLAGLFDRMRTRPSWGWLVAGGVVLAILAAPVRYRIHCDCELQPVTRRYVAAPFDGPLERTLVEPGDIVTRDQLLAQMDGREIEWELSGNEADIHRAKKEHDGYIAAHESGKAQIAAHEVERLRMRSDLLRHRIENLQIKCPTDGIVVSGDLTKSEGMPLKVGQTLFEVAPLHQMTVEVSVPEIDVRLVSKGAPIEIWLDAFPGRKWTSQIEQVHPRSEIKRDDNVFIAEVALPNDDGSMRPGMRGRASIATIRRPLAWNVLQRPTAMFLRWLGW